MKEGPIGFIGLGIMGTPMTRNLMKAGYKVLSHDKLGSRAEEMAKEGAAVAKSPADVARQCDITIIMVTDTPDVEAVILGPQGVIHGVRPGAAIIDMSTISPSATQRMAEEVRKKGAHMLDAPVSGGSWGAINATLAIMVGGEKEVFDRCVPVFQALGKSITHMGSHGAGQITKLVNQIIVTGTCGSVAEGLVFAAAHGMDLEKTIQAVGSGAAASWQLSNLGPRMIKGDFAPGFMVRLMQKDLRLILEAARDKHVSLPETSLVHQLYASLEADGLGGEGTQALIKVIEKLSGAKARIKPQ